MLGVVLFFGALRAYWILTALYTILTEEITYYDANDGFPIKVLTNYKITLKNSEFGIWIKDQCRISGGTIIERYFPVNDLNVTLHESCLCPKWKSYYKNSCQ